MRALGKRRDKPAWRRRWKSSTSKGERPTTALSHASTTREGVAKRWHGHVQAGLSSREISFPGCPHCPKGGRQHRWRRYTRAVRGPRAVKEPGHVRNLHAREPGDPVS